jgi:hypothetical protein
MLEESRCNRDDEASGERGNPTHQILRPDESGLQNDNPLNGWILAQIYMRGKLRRNDTGIVGAGENPSPWLAPRSPFL